MADILLLTQGTWGDIFPFVRIGNDLNARGHNVTLLSNEYFTEKIIQAGFDRNAAINIELFEEWNRKRNYPDNWESRLLHMKEQIGWIYEIIARHSHAKLPVLVSHFGLHLPVQMAVDRFKLPCLTVFTAPYFMLNTAIHAEHYAEHSKVLNGLRAEVGLTPVKDWHQWIRSARCGIGLWPEWFARLETDWEINLETVGFVSNEQPNEEKVPTEIQTFLRNGTKPVLINHGSSIPINENFFRIGVETCRAARMRAVVVTQYENLVRGCLGEDVMHYRFAHFPSLMPHMNAIIHAGGIGTTGNALAAGKPQLIMAMGLDGHDNGHRLCALGVAAHLPPAKWQISLTAETLFGLVRSQRVDERCRYIAGLFEHTSPLEKALKAIEKFIACQ